MPETLMQEIETHLERSRALRQKIVREFRAAARWNHAHPWETPRTDDEVDPEALLRTLDRHLWDMIADWEVGQAMGRYHRRLASV